MNQMQAFRGRVRRVTAERCAAYGALPSDPEEGQTLQLGGVDALTYRNGAWDSVSDSTGLVHAAVEAWKAAN